MPPRIINSLWSVCRNCLPTRARLQARGVNCPKTCVLYARDEDNMYIFSEEEKEKNKNYDDKKKMD
jgi:hypothetical protein